MRTITSRQNPLVATFRSAVREKRKRADRRLLVLDGVHLIDEALRARVALEIVVLSIGLLRRKDPNVERLIRRLDNSGIETVAASAPVLDAASPVRSPSGAVALARHVPVAMEQVFAQAGLVLGTVGVQDPGNVGAVIRAADAGEAAGVLVTAGSAEPFGWKALRGAMGSTFRLPVVDGVDVTAVVRAARTHSAAVLAAVPRGGASLYGTDLNRPALVLIGGEGGGLDATLSARADATVSIPMRREVESLNTAVAAALIVYEARRQRERGGGRSETAS